MGLYTIIIPLTSKKLQTRNGMIGTVQTQERGGAGKAQPPLNCLTHLNAALNAKTRLPSQNWLNRSSGVRRGSAAPLNRSLSLHSNGLTGAVGCGGGVQPPLNRPLSLHIWYSFDAGAGSAPFFVIRRITPYLFTHLSLTRN